jgi:hypothetical protein
MIIPTMGITVKRVPLVWLLARMTDTPSSCPIPGLGRARRRARTLSGDLADALRRMEIHGKSTLAFARGKFIGPRHLRALRPSTELLLSSRSVVFHHLVVFQLFNKLTCCHNRI